MASITESAKLNDRILASGCLALTNWAGTQLWFFPRGRLPRDLVIELNAEDGRLTRSLVNFLINLGKG